MDALELLKADHVKLKNLLAQLDETNDRKRIHQIFQSIKSELDVHIHIDETVFYPPFERYGELKDRIVDASDEHREMKEMLKDIEATSKTDENILPKLQELVETVEHHVSEEEYGLFPMIRRIMRRPEREQIGRHLEAAKREKTAA